MQSNIILHEELDRREVLIEQLQQECGAIRTVLEILERPTPEALNRVSHVVSRRGKEKPVEQVKAEVQVKTAIGPREKKPCPKHPAAPRYKNGQCRECALEYQRRLIQENKQPPATATAPPKRALPCSHGCGKEFTNEIWLRKHEEDCAHVIRPNGSASVSRHTN